MAAAAAGAGAGVGAASGVPAVALQQGALHLRLAVRHRLPPNAPRPPPPPRACADQAPPRCTDT
eukprot:568493-Prorocentrum_minimum.AAC.1